MNPELMSTEERIERASRLTLKAISNDRLIVKGMWEKYLKASYRPAGKMRVVCSKCRKPFPRDVNHFNLNKRNKDGLRAECRWCSTADAKLYKSKQPGYRSVNRSE